MAITIPLIVAAMGFVWLAPGKGLSLFPVFSKVVSCSWSGTFRIMYHRVLDQPPSCIGGRCLVDAARLTITVLLGAW